MPTDINTYDHGLMNIAVIDTPSTYSGQQMGELWVSYTIELRKPKFVTAMGWGLSRDYFQSNQNDKLRQPFGITGTGTSQVLHAQQNNIGTQLIQSTGNTVAALRGSANSYIFPQGILTPVPNIIDDWVVMYGIKFPPTYSGNLRISFRAHASANPNGPIIPFWLDGANLRPITDIPDGDGNMV